MNLRELRAELAFQLTAEEDAVDQSFTTARMSKALQQAYTREWERAKLHANVDWTKGYIDGGTECTWPLGEIYYKIPAVLRSASIIDIVDLSFGEPGVRLVRDTDYKWADRATLQWIGTTGPASAKPLRFYYEVVAEPLVDEAEPLLCPPQFQQLLVLSAACWLKTAADEQTPPEWLSERNELRLDYYKHVSKGRPLVQPPTVPASDWDDQSLVLT